MKLPNKFLRVLLAAMMIAGLSVLAGCGSDESDNSASGNKDAKNIVVATRGTVKPYSYTDDDGKLTGYDVDAHFCTSWKFTNTSNISCSEVELWSVVVEEWCMTTTFVLC